jgi:hypothetical protein
MAPEMSLSSPATAEKSAFSALVDLVEKMPRRKRRIDLVTFAHDHSNGSRQVFSQIGVEFGAELDSALDQVIPHISPYYRKGLEEVMSSFPPSSVRQESHFEIRRWEWSFSNGRFLGVETVVDDRRKEEWARTWYVRRPGKSLRERFKESLLGEAIAAKRRQILVEWEYELPPHTSTVEEFPKLSLRKAIEALRKARESTPPK